ncbi:MAG: polyphosphate kinase [Rhodospirillaceae bacterium]|nr:MAG: polyphosphate kinase [Rhodospirillaceae bacterium]
MFQIAELGQKVSREDFNRVAAALRTELLVLQEELKSEDFPVILMFAGVAGAGKAEALDLINEWMDPRWIVTRAYGPPSDEERERPSYWRFWRDLPPKGQIGLFVGCWYHQPNQDFVYKKISKVEYLAALDRIAAFERTLADDGALILKFWMHMDKATQKKRMKALEKDKYESWRITKQDWEHWKHNDKFEKAAEIAVRRTDSGKARWVLVEGADSRYRALTILTTLRDSIIAHREVRRARRKTVAEALEATKRLRATELRKIEATTEALEKASQAAATRKGKKPTKKATVIVTAKGEMKPLTVLDHLDMSLSLTDDAYNEALVETRAKLGRLCRRAHFEGKSALILFEGPDAAGKGGAIRRLTGSMDARDYRVIPVAAPTDEERAQHYLWRFWRYLPRAGRIAIFDRSWYGRVLVERVEGFAQPEEWMRAYSEINEFEEQLGHHGIVLAKFWVHISKDEQYRRFKERETISYKAWKLTAEDWRNRAKWDDYGNAVHEIVERTSTTAAPWTLVEGNDKKYARIKIMRTLCAALEKRLKQDGDGRGASKKKA